MIHRLNLISALVFLFVTISILRTEAQMERNSIDKVYQWKLSDLFPTDEDWNIAKEKLVTEINQVDSFKGKITQSAENLLAFLNFSNNLHQKVSRLYSYASMNSDTDTRNMKYSGMEKELQQIISDLRARSAFVDPEILSTKWDVIDQYIKEEPKLKVYRKPLADLFREKEHSLSEKEERIMGLSGLMSGTAQSIYNTFKDAEMPNPKITLSTGEEVTLSSAAYTKYRSLPSREDRKLVFDSFFNNFEKFEASYGEMLYGQVKSAIFEAKARHYESTLEAALFPQNIPVEIYHSLITNINNNLETFYRYLKLKKRMLNIDTLRYYDLYAPTVKDIDMEFSYDEAKEMVLKVLSPLGEDYVSTVKKALNERWIDVYPTEGKRSGAYSSGGVYSVHPFILLNYNDQYEDVGTLVHELGHTMQSYYSNKNQPAPVARYPMFVAEVASTFNEVLLFNEMIKSEKDDNVKLSLLMSRLEEFRVTLFRQTQFAEFELKVHQAAENGQPLTGEFLSKKYKEIVDHYYGNDQNICLVDDNIEMEWAYIPHFYYGFYVYQYSTSFTASNSLAQGVLTGREGALEKYLKFLKTGGSKDAIDMLKEAGVDMTTSQPFDDAINSMNNIMDQIEKILNNRK